MFLSRHNQRYLKRARTRRRSPGTPRGGPERASTPGEWRDSEFECVAPEDCVNTCMVCMMGCGTRAETVAHWSSVSQGCSTQLCEATLFSTLMAVAGYQAWFTLKVTFSPTGRAADMASMRAMSSAGSLPPFPLPPRHCQTGMPAAWPKMSHAAMSMAKFT